MCIRDSYSVANSVIRKINQVYAGNLNTLEASSGGTVLFFMVLIFIITGILGAFMVKEQKWLPVLAVFFPVFAITAAAGGRPGSMWLYLLLMILLLIFTAARSHLMGWKCGAAAVAVSYTHLFQQILCDLALCLRIILWHTGTYQQLIGRSVQCLYSSCWRQSDAKPAPPPFSQSGKQNPTYSQQKD